MFHLSRQSKNAFTRLAEQSIFAQELNKQARVKHDCCAMMIPYRVRAMRILMPGRTRLARKFTIGWPSGEDALWCPGLPMRAACRSHHAKIEKRRLSDVVIPLFFLPRGNADDPETPMMGTDESHPGDEDRERRLVGILDSFESAGGILPWRAA